VLHPQSAKQVRLSKHRCHSAWQCSEPACWQHGKCEKSCRLAIRHSAGGRSDWRGPRGPDDEARRRRGARWDSAGARAAPARRSLPHVPGKGVAPACLPSRYVPDSAQRLVTSACHGLLPKGRQPGLNHECCHARCSVCAACGQLPSSACDTSSRSSSLLGSPGALWRPRLGLWLPGHSSTIKKCILRHRSLQPCHPVLHQEC